MLKINLLPTYIYERRNVRRMAFLVGFIFIVLAAGMVTWIFRLSAQERLLTEQVVEMETQAKAVTELEADVAAEQAKIPQIKAKKEYVEAVLDYNEKLPELYEQVARYTYNRIEYRSINASGSSLQISAHARSVGDCGRYLLNMYRAGHLFSSVSISGVPGWPAGNTRGGGGGMMPGGMPGMAGGMPMPTMPGGMMGGMPGMPGAAGRSASNTASAADGFDFTVTCALVNPVAAPTYNPNAGQQQQGAGGPGMMMPGGMPGMPAGMPSTMPGGMPGMPGGAGSPMAGPAKS